MKTITIPCAVGEVIYYPVPALPLPVRPVVTEVRITEYGIVVEATNSRTGETFYFPENAFGKTVFSEEEKEKAFELAKTMQTEN